MVAAVGDVGERVSRPVAPLCRHHQGAVGKSDPLVGRRGEEPPFRLLQLAGEVPRPGPGKAVVAGAGHHDLGALGDVESGLGAVLHPLVLAGLAPHPHGPDEDFSGLGIDQDARIADAVFLLGPPTPFPHVHDHPLGPPGAAAVGAPAQPDVDVFLQVARLPSPHVVDAQQGPLGSGGQRGDAVGVHPFFHVLAQSHPNAFADPGSLVPGFHRSRRGFHGGADRIHPVPQVGVGLQPNREPEDVFPRRKLPVASKDQFRGGAGGIAEAVSGLKILPVSRIEQLERLDVVGIVGAAQTESEGSNALAGRPGFDRQPHQGIVLIPDQHRMHPLGGGDLQFGGRWSTAPDRRQDQT